MKIIIGSDHGGYALKEELKLNLSEQGFDVSDQGCFSDEAVDYPQIAQVVCQEVLIQVDAVGILICGTGIGMSIMANKMEGIRAGLCHTELEAKLMREHNNANVLCLGGRILGIELAKAITYAFLNNTFSGEERHLRRVELLRLYQENI